MIQTIKKSILTIIMWRSFGKKTVHMKNGKKFYITQNNANKLVQNIEGVGAQFQSFSNGKDLFIMINMQEISYID